MYEGRNTLLDIHNVDLFGKNNKQKSIWRNIYIVTKIFLELNKILFKGMNLNKIINGY